MRIKFPTIALTGLLLLTASAVKADTTVDVTASGFAPYTLDLSMVLTVTPMTGEFWFPEQAMLFQTTEYEVTSMTGTLDGVPIALAPTPAGIGPSWLYEDANYDLGFIFFSSQGSMGEVWNDNSADRVQFGVGDPEITWNATDPPPTNTPEPSAVLLSAMGMVALMGLSFLNDHNKTS